MPHGLARPFVLLSVAMTADGKIATANRKITRFGSRADLAHLYKLRSKVDAILCGARTAIESHANLGGGPRRFGLLRRRRALAPHPLRVIVSGSGRLHSNARVLRSGTGPVIVITAKTARPSHLARLRRLAHTVVAFGDASDARVNLPDALRWLRRDFGVRRLLCEGGGELNSALLQAGLVDELHLTICPLLFRGVTAPTIAGGPRGLPLSHILSAKMLSRRRRGDELFLHYRLRRSA